MSFALANCAVCGDPIEQKPGRGRHRLDRSSRCRVRAQRRRARQIEATAASLHEPAEITLADISLAEIALLSGSDPDEALFQAVELGAGGSGLVGGGGEDRAPAALMEGRTSGQRDHHWPGTLVWDRRREMKGRLPDCRGSGHVRKPAELMPVGYGGIISVADVSRIPLPRGLPRTKAAKTVWQTMLTEVARSELRPGDLPLVEAAFTAFWRHVEARVMIAKWGLMVKGGPTGSRSTRCWPSRWRRRLSTTAWRSAWASPRRRACAWGSCRRPAPPYLKACRPSLPRRSRPSLPALPMRLIYLIEIEAADE